MSIRASICMAVPAFAASGCTGVQSVFSDGGADAMQLSQLFYWMLGGAALLWVGMNGAFLYATRGKSRPLSRKGAGRLIGLGGIALPLVVLTPLLAYGLSVMPDQRAAGTGLRVTVTGESWWWRVEYWPKGATAPVVSANEIRLPVGQRTEIELVGREVIHALWIPALGGKMDIVPGRVNRMSLHPVRAGVWRGQCAEFCGLSHAMMALDVVAMEPGEFDNWLEAQAGGLGAGVTDAGFGLFQAQGCGGCHTLRGTGARGAVGPDLTHLGSRMTLGAGVLPMTPEAVADWLRAPQAFKPGVAMPAYDHMTPQDMQRLAVWLRGLE
ncbi:cytochrome B [Gemmobacter aquarius]|uniref:Cytochrome B n=2 Tax=Paragemmobacter aquarius TaxID=2169400 RepID=A0A2S0URE4_9RHOB|nr:cytochrome B [Gemmobacter aquarius]